MNLGSTDPHSQQRLPHGRLLRLCCAFRPWPAAGSRRGHIVSVRPDVRPAFSGLLSLTFPDPGSARLLHLLFSCAPFCATIHMSVQTGHSRLSACTNLGLF
ncbi:unnamed protein product [Protopolystoma xenopodis]|uniref:Uncharacterized protein n=1 Tax=Protopolystoma xenopodis TaxID=117903 RepID=A0A448WFS6_9PLAT|nr:unnamed protein product [Protopolystoma xenopodis]